MGNKQSSNSGGGGAGVDVRQRVQKLMPGSAGAAARNAPAPPASIKTVLERAQKSGVVQLSNAGLREMPEQIAALAHQLRNLDLSKNRLCTLPAFIGDFSALKQLHLQANQLTALPDEMRQLKKLEVLDVQHNQLTCLPATFVGMLSLKQLNLAENRFTDFPKVLCTMPSLETLDLSRNALETLPREAVKSLQVQELNLNQNRLNQLPDSLAECPRLTILRVEENCLPVEVFTERLLVESRLSTIALDGNLFSEKLFADLPGHDQFMERYTAVRKKMT